MNVGTDPWTGEPRMTIILPVSDTTYKGVEQNDEGALQYVLNAINNNYNYSYFGGHWLGDLNMGPYVSAGAQYYQTGIWNRSLDSGINGPGSTMDEIETLFNNGRGWAIDWRRDSIPEDRYGPDAEFAYRSSRNLVHLLQSGAVEEPFTTLQAGRDTGYHLPEWEGALDWTFSAKKNNVWWWHIYHDDGGAISDPGPGGSGPPPPDRYHQRYLSYSDGHDGWYDNLPNSWDRGTDIYDILSPLGTNGTTQYDFSYPGQHMSYNGGVMTTENQDDRNYPDFASWYASGANIFILPWVSGPYPPGYHKDDPNRPIKGGDRSS
jgi:hypothetical protein